MKCIFYVLRNLLIQGAVFEVFVIKYLSVLLDYVQMKCAGSDDALSTPL